MTSIDVVEKTKLKIVIFSLKAVEKERGKEEFVLRKK